MSESAVSTELKSVAFFDFDGTLTFKDAFQKFLQFSVSKSKYLTGMIILAPVIIAYKLKFIPNYKAKQIVFSWFFSGMEIENFQKLCQSFNEQVIPGMLRPEAMKKLEWHKANGHEVLVVSANFDLILDAWCRKNKIGLICTCLAVKDGKVTGNFSSRNCYGAEKVVRIQELFNLQEFKDIYAYGDSSGDRPMLSLANNPFFRTFY